MKTLNILGMFFGAILLTIGWSACSNDEFADYKTDSGVKKISSFTATISDAADTRTFLADAQDVAGKKYVYWGEKDAITVFSDLEPTPKSFMTKVGTSTTAYSSNTAIFSGETIKGNEFYAYYPGDDANFSHDKDHITLIHATLPGNDFGLNETIRTPMVAVSRGENLLFKQVTGLVNINLTGIYRLESVYLYGNNDEVLCGSGTIDLTADEPVFVLDPDQSESSNKRIGGRARDLLLNANIENIYFNLPPMTFEKGFTVEIKGYDKGGKEIVYKKSTGPNQVIKRGEINNYTKLNVTNDYIHFADSNVEQLCLQYFDTNGDGFLSYSEAYAVTEIPTIEDTDGRSISIFAGKERLGNKAVEITSFNELRYFSLDSIPDFAFFGQTLMTEVTLPDRLVSIGENAFGICYELNNILIPNTVTYIDLYAFNQCSKFTDIVIPAGVKTISMGTFNACQNLTRVSLPEGIETIEMFAFSGCRQLPSIVIPEGVTSIQLLAFQGCASLSTIVLPSTLKEIGYAAFDTSSEKRQFTCLAVNPPTLASKVFGDKDIALIYVPDKSVNTYKEASGWSDFADIIRSISGGDTISFADANVKALCVKYFDLNGDGEVSYREAAAVTEIPTYHNSTYNEDYPVFNGRKAVLGDNVVEITSFNELQYFTSLKSLPKEMFIEQSNLKEVKLPESLSTIGYFAFNSCTSLTSIEIPDGVMDIGYLGTFANCQSLTNVKLPAGLKTLPSNAFSQCINLTNIDLPEGLTTIKGSVFQGSGLTSIVIPASVTIIYSNAFASCTNLKSVTCLAVNPPTIGNVFYGMTDFTIYVPASSVADYKATSGWSDYADKIVAM